MMKSIKLESGHEIKLGTSGRLYIERGKTTVQMETGDIEPIYGALKMLAQQEASRVQLFADEPEANHERIP